MKLGLVILVLTFRSLLWAESSQATPNFWTDANGRENLIKNFTSKSVGTVRDAICGQNSGFVNSINGVSVATGLNVAKFLPATNWTGLLTQVSYDHAFTLDRSTKTPTIQGAGSWVAAGGWEVPSDFAGFLSATDWAVSLNYGCTSENDPPEGKYTYVVSVGGIELSFGVDVEEIFSRTFEPANSEPKNPTQIFADYLRAQKGVQELLSKTGLKNKLNPQGPSVTPQDFRQHNFKPMFNKEWEPTNLGVALANVLAAEKIQFQSRGEGTQSDKMYSGIKRFVEGLTSSERNSSAANALLFSKYSSDLQEAITTLSRSNALVSGKILDSDKWERVTGLSREAGFWDPIFVAPSTTGNENTHLAAANEAGTWVQDPNKAWVCQNGNRFLLLKTETRSAQTGWRNWDTKHDRAAFDCYTNRVIPFEQAKSLTEKNETLRHFGKSVTSQIQALQQMRNLLQNSYALYQQKQPGKIGSLKLGGIHRKKKTIFTGCNSIGVTEKGAANLKRVMQFMPEILAYLKGGTITAPASLSTKFMEIFGKDFLPEVAAFRTVVNYTRPVPFTQTTTPLDSKWIPEEMKDFLMNPCPDVSKTLSRHQTSPSLSSH